MFRKKTKRELEIRSLKIRLARLKGLRKMSIPRRPRKKWFSKYAMKNDITPEQVMSLEKIDDEIEELKKQLGLKKARKASQFSKR